MSEKTVLSYFIFFCEYCLELLKLKTQIEVLTKLTTIPLPHIDDTMTVTIEMIASNQFVWQLAMAEPESTRPMAITIGPVTTGGK